MKKINELERLVDELVAFQQSKRQAVKPLTKARVAKPLLLFKASNPLTKAETIIRGSVGKASPLEVCKAELMLRKACL